MPPRLSWPHISSVLASSSYNMIPRPLASDIKIIGYYLGKIIVGLGMVMILPAALALFAGELNPVLDFLIGIEITLIAGLLLMRLCIVRSQHPLTGIKEGDLNWMQGMIVVSLSWLAAMALGAIPLFLSGHWASYLDACFEAMSGFATTGLTLVADLDHLSYSHNFWRHLTMFIGGQGIVIVALSLFVKGMSGALKMYVGEARDERLLPNIIHTARFIWTVSIIYLLLGSLALGAVGIINGLKPLKAFFHGICLFMAAFDTGGFTLNSQSILYYHSLALEVTTVIIMLLGALNFKMHFQLWSGDRKEIFKNMEINTFLCTITFLFLLTSWGLHQSGIYPSAIVLFRKGFYQLISAHTGTGYTTLYPSQLFGEWNQLALIGLICAMALGGSISSTTGGIKIMRIGIIYKSLKQDLKRIIIPEKGMAVQNFHHIKEVFLDDRMVRSALTITLAYFILYILGAVVAVACGYPLLASLFESASAAANVGLSSGITQASMPTALKFMYIFQMWAGRLEFMSVFTLIGFLVALVRGR